MLTDLRLNSGMRAFLGKPKTPGKRPAVVQLHERYGIVKHTTDLTEKLAEAGYVTLAPDLLWRFTGDREALARGDIGVEIRDDQALTDLDEAIRYLRTLDSVDGSHIAIMGVCQTGRQPLLAAAHRNDLSAILVVYGGASSREWEPHELRPTPVGALIERVSCPVLGLFGEGDNTISLDDVAKWRNQLEKARKSYHIRVYREAPHGWLNDTMPGRYRPAAAKDAWQFVLSFLDKTLCGGWDRSRVLWAFESDASPSYDFSKNRRWA
jgi:carboxymethylenebutenolidase